jgi:hypothetical protein
MNVISDVSLALGVAEERGLAGRDWKRLHALIEQAAGVECRHDRHS